MKKVLFAFLVAVLAFGMTGCKIKPRVIIHAVVTDASGKAVAGQEVYMFEASIWNAGSTFQKPSYKEDSALTEYDGVAEFRLKTLDLDIMGKATLCFAIFDAQDNVIDYKVVEVRKGEPKEVPLSTKK